jgi:hypothetical protein
VLQFSLRNERVIFPEQEGGSEWYLDVATLRFNWTLFKKQKHHEVPEYKQDRYVSWNK